ADGPGTVALALKVFLVEAQSTAHGHRLFRETSARFLRELLGGVALLKSDSTLLSLSSSIRDVDNAPTSSVLVGAMDSLLLFSSHPFSSDAAGLGPATMPRISASTPLRSRSATMSA